MIFQRYYQVMDVGTYFSNQLLFFVPPMNALKSPGFISTFQCLFVSAGMFFVLQPTSFAYFSQTSICQWPFLVVGWGRPLTYGWACAFLILFHQHITHERRSPPSSPPLTASCISLFSSLIYHSQYFSHGQQNSNNRHCSSSSFIFLLFCHALILFNVTSFFPYTWNNMGIV